MQEFNIDFHIHSKYSGGTSDNMLLPAIARNAELKGLDCVGTGDATHSKWRAHMREHLREEAPGVYGIAGAKTKFITTGEVEDSSRVHHVIIFPNIEAAEEFSEKIKKSSSNLDADGRPKLQINGEEVVSLASESGALAGPSHAFTPWTSLYKEYNSIAGCYGKNTSKIKFLELGLSADSDMADRIEELQDITFTTNSDCHSPLPHRLGREFNRLLLSQLSFPEISKALAREGGRKFTLNAGLNPLEGKYHLTACSRCYLKFKLSDAASLKMRCPECKGIIKRGVMDRIEELASWEKPKHPPHRPPYLHILPLAEAIALAYGISTVTSKGVEEKWRALISKFGPEINVLVDANADEIKKFDKKVGDVIAGFRADKIKYVGGGGGKYGHPTLTGETDEYWGVGQKKLGDF